MSDKLISSSGIFCRASSSLFCCSVSLTIFFFVSSSFCLRGLASANDATWLILCWWQGMHYQQYSLLNSARCPPSLFEEKVIFFHYEIGIQEHQLRNFKADAVFTEVLPVLVRVPSPVRPLHCSLPCVRRPLPTPRPPAPGAARRRRGSGRGRPLGRARSRCWGAWPAARECRWR